MKRVLVYSVRHRKQVQTMTTSHSPTRLAILGSTGSIGTQALQVVAENPESFEVCILAAGTNREQLQQQQQQHPQSRAILVLSPPDSDKPDTFLHGSEALHEALEDLKVDLVLNGITGFAGLEFSLKALQCGSNLALANKESLVTAGTLLKSTAKRNGAEILPVDSEHNAIQQCLNGFASSAVSKISLTASGGPFRGWDRNRLKDVTTEQALAHPTWKMGPRISVDSATMFNKAFELIEAVELFGEPDQGIDVIVHPQSIIHALVEFKDGSSIAHLSEPDMRVPIRNALHLLQRTPGNFQPLDLVSRGELTFEAVDHQTFLAIEMAREVLKKSGTTLGTVFNAADEVAVHAFLSGDSGFLTIYDLVARAIDEHEPVPADSLEVIREADLETRNRVRSWIP